MMELATRTRWKIEALRHAVVEVVVAAAAVEGCEESSKQRD